MLLFDETNDRLEIMVYDNFGEDMKIEYFINEMLEKLDLIILESYLIKTDE